MYDSSQPYASQRSPVAAENLVATSQPLAVEAGMQVDLHQGGEWGFDVDELLRLNGGQRYATYQNSTGKLRDYVDQVIDSWWFFQHQDIAGGRIGRWKRDFLLPIMKLAETRKLEALKADGTAAITVQEKRMYEELTTNLGKKRKLPFITS